MKRTASRGAGRRKAAINHARRREDGRAQQTERKASKAVAITPAEYNGIQFAFDYFNAALFNRALPDVFITYQRHAHSRGHFAADRFTARFGQFREG